jgi:site-specific DNA recombinase
MQGGIPLSKTMVFGYVRVSTENQIENYSIDEQIYRLNAYCKAKDWKMLKIYTDGGYSGGNTDRPALKKMLSDIKTTDVDIILVYKLDRLSRSQKDTLTLIEDEFIANKVDFVSICENFDTSTAFGRAMIGILSVFAQLEKDQITERFTMGRIGRSKSGYFHGGGNSPFGYTYENGELIVCETEAIIVREIYNLFLAGKSINAISRTLISEYGGKWSANKIRNILTNVIYIGKVKFAKVEYDGRHTPVISKDTFAAVQALLNSSERESKKTAAQKTPFRAGYLLSSLIVCDRCGARYSANHGYYKCYSRSKSCKKFIMNPNCKNTNWKIEELDSLVINSIYEMIENHDLLNNLLKNTKKPEAVDIKKTEVRLKEIQKQIENLIDLYQIGNAPMDLLSNKIKNLDLEKNILQRRIEKTTKYTVNTCENFINSIKDFEKHFSDSALETQRLLISSLIEKVHVNGSDITIDWRV